MVEVGLVSRWCILARVAHADILLCRWHAGLQERTYSRVNWIPDSNTSRIEHCFAKGHIITTHPVINTVLVSYNIDYRTTLRLCDVVPAIYQARGSLKVLNVELPL